MADTVSTPAVIITESVYKKAGSFFETAAGFTVLKAADDEESLAAVVKKSDPVAVVIGSDRYTGKLYETLTKGSLIARFGVGCDGVNFAKAKEYGHVVTNTPHVLESTVAELTVFLAGEVLRRVGGSHEQMVAGEWRPGIGGDLHGKTWAILGMGAIGMQLSRILSFGFGLKVIGAKRNTKEADMMKRMYGVDFLTPDFDEAVHAADIVSIHIPATQDTYHYLDERRLSRFKRGALFINTGRGSLVDEVALFNALKDGHLSGAGLDVFENEPYVPVRTDKDLRTLSNVVMTPHIGSSTSECLARMAHRVLRNIRLRLENNLAEMDIKTA